MPKLYLGEAIGLLVKTAPFVWLRLGSYLLLGAGLGLYFGVIGGLAWLLGSLWGPLGWVVFLVGFGGAFGIVRWVTRYYFYLLKAAHTAVMTEVVVSGAAPADQIRHGRMQVQERFRDTSILFAVDQLVDGIVKRLARTVTRITGVLPIPGIDGLGRLLERVAVASTTFVDESILSRAYAKREANVWKVAHDGVVLYAQAWQPILANAVVLVLLSYVWFLVLLVALGLPAVAIGAVLPGLRVALAIGVIIGAWMIKLAVADAFALAATLLAYHRATEGMTPNPEWVAKLEGVSDRFQELGRRAVEGMRTAPVGDVTTGSVPRTADQPRVGAGGHSPAPATGGGAMAAPPPVAAGDMDDR
ncbi:hypothetical protein BH23DEI1_BH23DEI1_13070 [soil metagenome]